MPFIENAGIKIYHESKGAGAPLICIAGLAATHDAWALIRPALAEKFQATVFDNRGIGQTQAPATPFDIDQMADDTAALMDALGLDNAVIAGHSMGCAIALTLARRHPGKVRRLALCNPFARMRPAAEAVFRTNARLWRDGVPPAQLFQIIMPWMFSDAFLADGAKTRGLLDISAGMPAAQSVSDFERQIDAVSAFDATGWLDQVRQPTLLLAGEYDILTPPSEAQLMANAMRCARLTLLPAAHAAPIEAPDACARLIAHE